MRTIEDHKINPANNMLTIKVLDEPGAGGACHEYHISGPDGFEPEHIGFQNGPITDVGINGLTQEVLIAICIDRLRSFQAGQYACRENGLALTDLESAMNWLHQRARKRMARWVEGTSRLYEYAIKDRRADG